MIKMFFSSNFVNNHGYNHEMLTVKKCWGIITQGQPESEYRFDNLILQSALILLGKYRRILILTRAMSKIVRTHLSRSRNPELILIQLVSWIYLADY